MKNSMKNICLYGAYWASLESWSHLFPWVWNIHTQYPSLMVQWVSNKINSPVGSPLNDMRDTSPWMTTMIHEALIVLPLRPNWCLYNDWWISHPLQDIDPMVMDSCIYDELGMMFWCFVRSEGEVAMSINMCTRHVVQSALTLWVSCVPLISQCIVVSLIARFMGPTWVLSAPGGPCEPCYLGSCLNSFAIWTYWFQYITKLNLTSKTPNQAIINRAFWKSYAWFCGSCT